MTAKNNKKTEPQKPVELNTQQDQVISIPEVSIGSSSVSLTPSKGTIIGKEISINLKATTFFGIGDIWLTPDNYWAVVPDNLSDRDYAIILASLKAGTIKLGKQFIPPVDKASDVRERYWFLIERTGFETKASKQAFKDLMVRGTDDGWTAIEIANFCLDKENNGRKRKDVIRMLTKLVDNYDGPISLYDPPDSAEGIKKVTIKSDGTIVAETNSGKKVAKPLSAPPPQNHLPGNKSSEEAMNDLLK